MINYVNSLIAVMIVCQIAVSVSPSNESSVRSIRLICAVVALLTLLSPIGSVISMAGDIENKITSFIVGYMEPEERRIETMDTFEAVTAQIVSFVSDKYDVGEINAVLLTDETDSFAVELQLYIKNCPYTKRSQIETDLTNKLGFSVYVMCE